MEIGKFRKVLSVHYAPERRWKAGSFGSVGQRAGSNGVTGALSLIEASANISTQ